MDLSEFRVTQTQKSKQNTFKSHCWPANTENMYFENFLGVVNRVFDISALALMFLPFQAIESRRRAGDMKKEFGTC